MRKLMVLTCMILSVIILPSTIYALQNGKDATEKSPEEIAFNWLINSPTFKFDGIPETVVVKNRVPLRMPNSWDVYIEFTCNYPGYGDRTGNVMLGHSQVHTIKIGIIVIENQITSAIIDGMWDEVNQIMLT